MGRALAAAVLLGTSLLLLAACGGTTGVASRQLSVGDLSRSATTSAAATSARFAFDTALGLPGAKDGLSFSGEGAFDKASDRASFAVDMSGFAKLLGGFVGALGSSAGGDVPAFDDPAAWKIEAVQDGKVAYVRFPAVAKSLPAGKSWIRADGSHAKVDGFDLGGLEQSARTDPRRFLDVLKAAGGTVETVGTDTLRGTETTHYRATLDPAAVAKLGADASPGLGDLAQQLEGRPRASDVPVDVWLDDTGLVRKLSLSFSSPQAGPSRTGSASMTFELWDYGENVSIEVPPASEVVDASALRS